MSGLGLTLHVEKRQIVTPGELLAQGDYYPDLNTFREGESVYSTIMGIFDHRGNRLSVVPLKHCYIPYVDDLVIGKIVDVGMSGWMVDINSPYPALLPATEVVSRQHLPRGDGGRILEVGDLIKAKVIAADRTRDPLLTIRDRGLGKISRGRVLKISPSKIPRLIGKEGSMINMLKKESSCSLNVGQNGVVLVTCETPEKEELVIDVIKMIEREAHTQGLTDRVLELMKTKIRG
ncbi:MAG: exosome complex RNA-binding protein Rrp4 [Candidatus Bathyarchaeia archaeon]